MDGYKPNIIICGDIMLDHNIYTTIGKIANEAPIPVFNHIRDEYMLGGCGNVLKNIHALGCNNIYIFSSIGNDANGSYISDSVNKLNIHNHLLTVDNYKTTTKQRYYCDNKIMFRCDTELEQSKHNILTSISIIESLEVILKKEHIDCIILSDYDKGFLHVNHCRSIIDLANKYNVLTCVDPKNDYSKYIGCSIIKPNRKEAYRIFKFSESRSIQELHAHIYETVKCKYSVITLAEKGITLYDGKQLYSETPTVHTIIDVTGAGDIVCSILAFFLPSGKTIQSVLQLATNIATKSVEYAGTYTIKQSDIHSHKYGKCIDMTDIEEVKQLYLGKKIVFTNGCFDVIHSGHIQLFKYCRDKGDIVIVGMNSDESIRRLKGPNRPINDQHARLGVLESIQYIDHIVIFTEDTPHSLIKSLCPYYLIKGGDYAIESIVGRENATETIIFNYINGFSSTNIINKMKGA